MKSIRSLFSVLLLTIIITSCNKKDQPAAGPKLYMMSIEVNSVNNNNFIRYIANGVERTIADGVTETAFGEDMEVVGADVYVLASRTVVSTGVQSHVVYKNGVAIYTIPFSNNFSPNCLAVSGSDVYLAGTGDPTSSGYKIKLWKNGTLTDITNGSLTARAYDMQVVGTDVYIAGYEVNPSVFYYQAKYWKNGTPVVLSAGTSQETTGELHRILVKGIDVYCSGMIDYRPTQWKNGTATQLNPNYGTCYGIAVAGSDIYAAGTVQNSGGRYHAAYWKNGTQVTLSDSTSAPNGASVFGIGTDGTDVYVIGSVSATGGSYKGVYWKNGTRNTLPASGQNESYGYRMVFK
jgi:hypothetical protein